MCEDKAWVFQRTFLWGLVKKNNRPQTSPVVGTLLRWLLWYTQIYYVVLFMTKFVKPTTLWPENQWKDMKNWNSSINRYTINSLLQWMQAVNGASMKIREYPVLAFTFFRPWFFLFLFCIKTKKKDLLMSANWILSCNQGLDKEYILWNSEESHLSLIQQSTY